MLELEFFVEDVVHNVPYQVRRKNGFIQLVVEKSVCKKWLSYAIR